MNRPILSLACMSLTLTMGCAPKAVTKFEFAGAVSESKLSPGRFAFGDANKVKMNGKGHRHSFKDFDEWENERMATKLSFQEQASKAYDFRLVLAPTLSGQSFGAGKGRGYMLHSDPHFVVREGWMFAWGTHPVGQTTYVEACGDGTTLVVEAVDSNTTRAYFLGPPGCKVKVKCLADNSYVMLNTAGTYVEVVAPCSNINTTTIHDIVGSPNQAFIDTAKKIAQEAGWNPANTFCFEAPEY